MYLKGDFEKCVPLRTIKKVEDQRFESFSKRVDYRRGSGSSKVKKDFVIRKKRNVYPNHPSSCLV